MLCLNCNAIMRAGPVIDSYNQIKFCPVCGITKIVSIGGHDDKTQQLFSRPEDKAKESDRRKNH